MKTTPTMYFEHEPGIVHCACSNGQDYTLCGFTLDGDQGEITEVTGPNVKITCGDCLGIIAFCDTVPKRVLGAAVGKD